MKKIITLTICLLGIIQFNFSQYFYTPASTPGNPGGLNTDSEYPSGSGLPAGWTVILGPSNSNPTWSTVENIGFPFNFNGNPVSQYKVSSTGVLTFSTGASNVPSANNAAIPDLGIPDNSVMVWGLQGTGTNDNIVTKTFGTAGGRQHWVFFSSYTAGSWTYWSIVMEEGTDKIYIVDQRHSTSANPQITAGIQIDGSTAIMVAGSPTLTNVAGGDPTPADNHYYEFYLNSASCINPYSFVTSNRTINSADLSWIGNPSAINYNIEFGISGFSQGLGTLLSNTNPSYSFTGLTPSQFYDVYVQTVCDTTDSSTWTGPITFSTLCVENAPFLENYDNSSFPVCFVQGNDDIFDWTVDANGTASASTGPSNDITGGGNYIYIEASSPRITGDSAVIFSPYINKGSLSGAKLTFYSHMYGASIGDLRVEASDDGGSTYSTIFLKSGDQGDQWNYETVCLDNFLDTIIFKVTASVGDNGSGTSWYGDIAIDNFEISQSVDLDLAGISVTTDSFLVMNNSPFTISGNLHNLGCNTISSMDINYSVNGSATATMPVSNINFLTGDIYSFNHMTTWTPTTSGTYNVAIWASNINGSADMDLSNDTAYATLNVFDNFVQRVPMLEVFTSSTCPPCVQGNINLKNVLSNYNQTDYTLIKYQMSWPGSGDPYYTQEAGDRRTFYGVNSVPRLEIDGGYDGNPSGFTTQEFDESAGIPSFSTISANYSVYHDQGQNSVVDMNVTIDPIEDFNSNDLTLFVAIIEYATYNNTGSNGETEFLHVMKKMIPSSSGTAIPALQAGVQESFNFSYNFQGQYTLPVDANSPINHMNSHSVEDFDNLGVVVWVQDVNTKEVLQSTTASIVANVEENIAASRLMIFPNPSSEDYTNLVIESSERGMFEIMIINTLGEIVLMDNVSVSKNLTQYQLDNSKLSNGMYNVIIQTPSIQSSKKLQILR